MKGLIKIAVILSLLVLSGCAEDSAQDDCLLNPLICDAGDADFAGDADIAEDAEVIGEDAETEEDVGRHDDAEADSEAFVDGDLSLDADLWDGLDAHDSGEDEPEDDSDVDTLQPYTHEDVNVEEVWSWLEELTPMTLVDVREPGEYESGHIAGALNYPLTSGVLESEFDSLPGEDLLVVYCASGNRSNRAATFLAEQGFRPVYDMLGGVGAWTGAGYPLE